MQIKSNLENDLLKLKNPQKAILLAKFFKTGKGEYGEGDRFIGLVVPQIRSVAHKYFKEISLDILQRLLSTTIHEYRLTALIILTLKYKKADDAEKKNIFNFYLKNTKNINNWDLVDLSSPNIIGGYLLDKDRKVLYKLAQSSNLWEKRIAIIATSQFIKNLQFEDTLKIAEILLKDKHDLIHKAVGWMLREVGKKDIKAEENFLQKYYKLMPRTMLRYAIEKFSEEKIKFYLSK